MSVAYPLRLFFDCSTAHLSPASRTYLEHRAACSEELIGTTPYGWFLWTGDGPGGEVPADLAGIIVHAHALDADYILFDRDAQANEALPIFDWLD